jgi:hypothetical protein
LALVEPSLVIANTGTAGMSWSIDTTSNPLPSWLTLGQSSGTLTDQSTVTTVALHIDATGLAHDDTYTLAIKLNGTVVRYVTIYLNVSA